MKPFFMISLFFLSSCSSQYLKYEKDKNFFKNEEFEREVKIITPAQVPDTSVNNPTVSVSSSSMTSQVSLNKDPKKKLSTAHASKTNSASKIVNANLDKSKIDKKSLKRRQPDLEDAEGFSLGLRRPDKDPFLVGEKVVHAVKYFSAEAGRLHLEVKPFVQVNDRKSYNFSISLQSSRIFSNFYSVDDRVETYLDYEELIPHVLKVNIKESGKLAQSQSYFNEKTLKASFWEKKYTEKNGEEEKKYTWDILPFSQNAFSGLFYMRIFSWKLGKEISFRVAEDKKNIVFTGKAVAVETLETEAGQFEAVKIKASIVSRGALSQTGDIFIWVSNDERKYLLRIEAKIKIGTLVSEIVELKTGL